MFLIVYGNNFNILKCRGANVYNCESVEGWFTILKCRG